MIKAIRTIFVLAIFLTFSNHLLAAEKVTALVGGTLIDGFGAPPIRNSVIVIQGERIIGSGTRWHTRRA